jgi:DNA-binding transcriptional ArsR family regulator
VEAWLGRPRKPGETISGALVQIGSHMFEHVTTWDADEEVGPDRDGLRRIAAIGEALSSDVRLAILQRLLDGSKTTAQLVESVPIDRSQLYHHVRDLFVHGLVEQPERGRYEATARGKMALLLAGHLGAIGPETLREAAELDLGE